MLQMILAFFVVCGILGIDRTVLHNGYAAEFSKEEFTERNVAFFSEFYPLLEEYGLTAANIADKVRAVVGMK